MKTFNFNLINNLSIFKNISNSLTGLNKNKFNKFHIHSNFSTSSIKSLNRIQYLNHSPIHNNNTNHEPETTITQINERKKFLLNKKKKDQTYKGVRNVVDDHNFTSISSFTAPSTEPLRVNAFCTAEMYKMGELLSCLQKIFIILPFITDDVFHVRLSDPIDSSNTSNMELDSTKDNSVNFAEAFIFDNGTFATWGASHQEIEKLLKVVKQVEVNRYSSVETEWFSYCVDLSQPGGLIGDLLVIGHDLPQHQSKLAFSAGLTRSVKLASLEEQLDKHLNKHKHIPEILLKGKKLPLSRSKVLQNLGELFSLRGQVNLHSELLDSPDFCWSTTKMEDYFDRISRNLDVRPRIAICNKKLDYANELAEVLRNHLHEEHSIRLEWIIIILISVEIVFNVIEYCERHFNNKNS